LTGLDPWLFTNDSVTLNNLYVARTIRDRPRAPQQLYRFKAQILDSDRVSEGKKKL
jgi:hypothetical protein